ncbi:hypothetical protein N0V87_010704 [Didymella glomerata]|uniref:Ankyrin n=1 Tax=Didymella glomerata TaxID=749621 RepID=A0A9W9BV68_9PLEO|nr:hypothetical protein N0V87_010704 [Didymella glomerata]
MMEYFLGQEPTNKYSNELYRAIQAGSELATVELLLEQGNSNSAGHRPQYGSAALKMAIRNEDYDLLKLLARVADAHGLEQIEGDRAELDYVDPFGEAILLEDYEAVCILLKHGANPDALVSFWGLTQSTPRVVDYSALDRMTALLVAIDVGSLHIVQLLVERGADVNSRLGMGVLRSPLQRAAEIGDFSMVEFLIGQGALIDLEPAYGGGTALQLAAMSGHVGIAEFLIERGADVNHPPARGPGRMAFEAAAEWCRPDVMYLLAQPEQGLQLDLEVTTEFEIVDCSSDDEGSDDSDMVDACHLDVRTQYERAIAFAEARNDHASIEIVRSIYASIGGRLSAQIESF